jgi:hypothetical protein
MNVGLLGSLLGLRYRLLWAKVRSRNGKIALFFVGYLLAVLIFVLLALGGFGAALAVIQLGKARLVAGVVLGSFYADAILVSVILGVGMTQAFSDAALRRYPLSAGWRMAARHLTAFLEPLWIFVLALDAGLAAGFSVFGGTSFWLGAPAAVLLVLTNYLLASVLAGLVERVLATRAGPILMLILGASPLAIPLLLRHAGLLTAAIAAFNMTPPGVAATVMGGAATISSICWLLLLLGWCLGLVAALVALERRPVPSRTAAGFEVTWDHPCDRIAALFGSGLAPLAGKMMRYYIRSPQLRFNYPLVLPSFIVLVAVHTRTDPAMVFPGALAAITVIGGLCTGALSLNVFGFDGPGFRRYFLLPVAPATVLRTASLVALIPGASLIPVALLLWLILSPVPTDARMMVMLLSSGLAGLFFFQALGVWTSLLAPRPIEFTATFGNKLSLAANAVMVGCIAVFFGLSLILSALGTSLVLSLWWAAPAFMAASAAFHLLTLRTGARLFVARRERMLSVIEGLG